MKAVDGMKSESRQVEDEDEDERIFACSINLEARGLPCGCID